MLCLLSVPVCVFQSVCHPRGRVHLVSHHYSGQSDPWPRRKTATRSGKKTHNFVSYLVDSFVHSLTWFSWFIFCIGWLISSVVDAFVCSFIHSLNKQMNHWLNKQTNHWLDWLIDWLIVPLLIYSFICLFIHSLINVFIVVVDSLVCLFVYLFTH